MTDRLIVFYSRADENYVSGVLKQLKVGNTQVAAGIIQQLTGADLFQIQQAKPYAKGYNECIAQAQRDQQRDARPELKTYPDDLDRYDTIYLGFPNYWSTMPMAVFTFLEASDFTGKTIRPFCTHEGSGMGVSERDIRRLCPGALVGPGLAIHGSNVEGSRERIERWVKE